MTRKLTTRDRGTTLEAVHAPRLSQIVFDQILAQIRDGRVRPGTLLPSELDLMRQTGVGRSSVREAIRGLAAMGLVSAHPGRGTRVLEAGKDPFSEGEVSRAPITRLRSFALFDLLEVREAVEGRAAELAAMRATDRDIAELRELAGRVAADVTAGRTYFESNRDFHVAIARAAHNPILESAMRNLVGQVRDSRERLMRNLRDMPSRDLDEHRDIVEAIAARDVVGARNAALVHLASFRTLVEKQVSTSLAGPPAADPVRRRGGKPRRGVRST